MLLGTGTSLGSVEREPVGLVSEVASGTGYKIHQAARATGVSVPVPVARQEAPAASPLSLSLSLSRPRASSRSAAAVGFVAVISSGATLPELDLQE